MLNTAAKMGLFINWWLNFIYVQLNVVAKAAPSSIFERTEPGLSWPNGIKRAVHFLIDDDQCTTANSVPCTVIDDFLGVTTIPGPIFCRLLVMSLSSGAIPSLMILSPLLCKGPRVTFLLCTWLSSPIT